MIRSLRRRLAAGVAAALSSLMTLTLGYPPPVRAAGTHCRPVEANGYSVPAGISSDGRYAIFTSVATNLIPGGASGWHLYVRDLRRCVTALVDVTVAGAPAQQGISGEAYLSANGRYAAFSSSATDLVPGDTKGMGNVFLRDLRGATTELISSAYDGGAANGTSWTAGVSTSGRYVLFVSTASNLLPDGPPPNTRNVYLRDRALDSTTLVATVPPNSVAPAWVPQLSPDGRFSLIDLIPTSPAGERRWLTNLVNDRTRRTDLVSVSTSGELPDDSTYGAGVSASGRFVLFNSSASDLVPGDTNAAADVFVRDMAAGRTARINVSGAGSQSSGGAVGSGISRDGRYAVFWSRSADLVPGDTNGVDDVFVRDLVAGTTVRVSTASDGRQGTGGSSHPRISANGRFVVFWSDASDLVPDDTNSVADAFVRDLFTGTTVRVSTG